ncbi:MAG TPA: amidohydrolase [Caldisericia bacterium]|nr:amidohydrolase [Caldisericia bacterium]
MKTVIVGKIIPFVPTMPEEFDGYVIVEENQIIDVGIGQPDGYFDKIVDGPKQVVIPGLTNTHTHAAMSMFRGVADDLQLQAWLEKEIFPREDKLTDEIVYWATKLAIAELLLGGVTCFADMYFFMDEVAKAVSETGIRACLSKGLVSFSGEKEIEVGRAFCQKWQGQGKGRIHTMLGPHAIYTCPPAYMEKVIRVASDRHIPIHMHVSETKKEVSDCISKNGGTPVAVLNKLGAFEVPFIAAHCVHLEDEDMEIMAKKGVVPSLNVSSNFKLASGMPRVEAMEKAGLKMTIGTDGPASNNDLNMFEEMRWTSFCAKVTGNPQSVPAYRALEMATKNGAHAMGWKNLGIIAPGQIADIVILDYSSPRLNPVYSCLSHVIYAGDPSDVMHVMVDGEFVVWNRKITTFDVQETIEKVNEFAKDFA